MSGQEYAVKKNGAAKNKTFDVILIGAGIAGCAAAILYGRQGLHVLVVDSKPCADDCKKLCTTFIQPSALPVIQKLGIEEAMEQNGGIRNSAAFWTPHGWVNASEQGEMLDYPLYGYSIRREELDPLIRKAASDTPNVELRFGCKVTDVLEEGGTIGGVVYQDGEGKESRVTAQLVVGADGRHSRIVGKVGFPTQVRPNSRAVYFAYYENLPLKSGQTSQFWGLNPDYAFAYPFGLGLTMLCAYVDRSQRKAWSQDVEGHLARFFENLPDGPDMGAAKRVSEVRRMLDMKNARRQQVYKGMALIGDAALSSDPVAGIGCGWAMQGADLLVTHTASALQGGQQKELAAGLEAYRKAHKKLAWSHHDFIAENSTGRKMTRLEHAISRAAVRDQVVANRLHLYTGRHISPLQFLRPSTLGRVIAANSKYFLGRFRGEKTAVVQSVLPDPSSEKVMEKREGRL